MCQLLKCKVIIIYNYSIFFVLFCFCFYFEGVLWVRIISRRKLNEHFSGFPSSSCCTWVSKGIKKGMQNWSPGLCRITDTDVTALSQKVMTIMNHRGRPKVRNWTCRKLNCALVSILFENQRWGYSLPLSTSADGFFCGSKREKEKRCEAVEPVVLQPSFFILMSTCA